MASRGYAIWTAVGILLASGIACHALSRDSAELDGAADRVEEVPKVIGDWQAQTEVSDERAFEQAGARGYWTRTYINQRTRDAVQVILMCGRPGKMAVHTPEVCYGGAGFELREQPAAYALKSDKGDAGQLWTAQFQKKGVVPARLRLYWGWSSRGEWQASPSPRWQFRGEPFLYKLYVSRDTTGQPTLSPQADPTAEFLRQFVPALNRTLFGNTREG